MFTAPNDRRRTKGVIAAKPLSFQPFSRRSEAKANRFLRRFLTFGIPEPEDSAVPADTANNVRAGCSTTQVPVARRWKHGEQLTRSYKHTAANTQTERAHHVSTPPDYAQINLLFLF